MLCWHGWISVSLSNSRSRYHPPIVTDLALTYLCVAPMAVEKLD